MALSGFKKSEISVQVKDGILFISGKSSEEEKNSYLHQGIAKRAFSKQLQLSEYVECKGASMEDGMLKVELVYNPPVEKKAKVIDIK
jgi:molecular chaperone IbpA